LKKKFSNGLSFYKVKRILEAGGEMKCRGREANVSEVKIIVAGEVGIASSQVGETTPSPETSAQ
jgi:hypothetical protein